MSEIIPKAEIYTTPNRQLVEELLSEAIVNDRINWLNEQLESEDSSLFEVNNLLTEEHKLREASYEAMESSDFNASRHLQQKADDALEMATKTYGIDAIAEAKTINGALEFFNKRGNTLFYWGDDAVKIHESLYTDTESTVNDSNNPVESNGDRETFKEFLENKPFIGYSELTSHVSEPKHLVLAPKKGEVFNIPSSHMISAGSFESWAGRDDGEGDKSYTKSNGEHVIGRSLDAIIDYAKRDTPIPPLEDVTAFVQPNGIILYAAPISNHRTSALIARGETTLPVNGFMSIYLLDHDIFPSLPE